MNLPKRVRNRLTKYDYSTANAYFITICTDKRKMLLWKAELTAAATAKDVPLSQIGETVDWIIRNIPVHYPAVSVDHYVIMPNHVHLLLQINTDGSGRPMAAPTLSTIINQMKGAATKQVGFAIWQKGFYDHVIRGENDYREIWNYIEGNPSRWMEDELYAESDCR